MCLGSEVLLGLLELLDQSRLLVPVAHLAV